MNKKSVKEELYKSGIGKSTNTLIYNRDGNNIESNEIIPQEIAIPTSKMLKNNPYSSLLSLNNEFPILTDMHIDNVFSGLEKNLRF